MMNILHPFPAMGQPLPTKILSPCPHEQTHPFCTERGRSSLLRCIIQLRSIICYSCNWEQVSLESSQSSITESLHQMVLAAARFLFQATVFQCCIQHEGGTGQIIKLNLKSKKHLIFKNPNAFATHVLSTLLISSNVKLQPSFWEL